MMNPDAAPHIKIEAQVLEYIPDAMTDTYQDKRFAAFDAAVLAIQAPANMANRQSIIYLPQPTNPNSPWRKTGAKLSFHIAVEMFEPGTIIFGSAVHDLQIKQSQKPGTGEVENE